MQFAAPGSQEENVGRLFLAAFVVIALPALPLGNYISYPFTILTTWYHEMGHGLTAMALGYEFQKLLIFANGSGLAQSSYAGDPGALRQAMVAAGGPLAPAMFGSGLIIASARRSWRLSALYLLAGLLLLSVMIWVRSLVGMIVLPLIALGLILLARKAADGWHRFCLQFLGLLGALSMFGQWDYLLTEQAVIAGRPMLSDTGAIEAHLFLPHWFWAISIVIIAAVMIVASLKYALRGRPRN
jgi:hypothetical protein